MKALILLLFALMMLPLVGFAQVTYVYTGAVMTGTLTGQNAFPGATQIIGIIVLPTALAPNQANQIVTPIAYQFVNTGNVLSSAQLGFQSTTRFSISTSNGAITAWDISLYSNNGTTTVSLSSTQSGDQYTFDQGSLDCFYEPGIVCSYWNASSTSNGVWTILLDDQAQSQLDAANQKIVALERELNSMHKNNVYLTKLCYK